MIFSLHMQTYTATITSQGQITIPAVIRRLLRMEETRKVALRADGNEVIIRPLRDILEFRGIFASKKRRRFSRVAERRAFEEALAKGEA